MDFRARSVASLPWGSKFCNWRLRKLRCVVVKRILGGSWLSGPELSLDSSEDEDGAASKPDLTREGMADKDKRK